MARSHATTVKEYLQSLPDDPRQVIAKVRSVIRKHLPNLKTLPDTYNGQPLCYAALAAQKNHNALYLMCAYGSPKHRADLEGAFSRRSTRLPATRRNSTLLVLTRTC